MQFWRLEILEMISKTPNQRHIHDSLQRAARDRVWGIKAARRVGREEGVQISQIRILEKLLNDQPTADELLARLTLSEVHERVSLLKDRLNHRGNS